MWILDFAHWNSTGFGDLECCSMYISWILQILNIPGNAAHGFPHSLALPQLEHCISRQLKWMLIHKRFAPSARFNRKKYGTYHLLLVSDAFPPVTGGFWNDESWRSPDSFITKSYLAASLSPFHYHQGFVRSSCSNECRTWWEFCVWGLASFFAVKSHESCFLIFGRGSRRFRIPTVILSMDP